MEKEFCGIQREEGKLCRSDVIGEHHPEDGKEEGRRLGRITLWCWPEVAGAHLDHVFVSSCVCSHLPNDTGTAPNAGMASCLFLKSCSRHLVESKCVEFKEPFSGVCM